MNREIKFRVWNGVKMVYDIITGKFGTFYVNPSNNGIDERDSACLSPLNTKYPDGIPLMQFTGLKDKNGKEIYEGDVIVEEIETKKYQPFVVKWHDEYAGFDMSSSPSWTILGNIYENPELLKN